jgi:hypothetical protein
MAGVVMLRIVPFDGHRFVVARGESVMLRAFFERPRTGGVDWVLVALSFISLFSFIGVALLQIYATAK